MHQKRFSTDIRNGYEIFKTGSGKALVDIQAKGRKFVSCKIMRIRIYEYTNTGCFCVLLWDT